LYLEGEFNGVNFTKILKGGWRIFVVSGGWKREDISNEMKVEKGTGQLTGLELERRDLKADFRKVMQVGKWTGKHGTRN